MMARPLLHRSPIPGLGISAGITITLLSLVVLLPIGALLLKGATAGPDRLWTEVNTPRIWAALWLSFRLSFLAATFNLIFGTALAWVLARYRFPGRRLIDAAVDLPFALPTAVAGIALTVLYAPNGAFGALAKDLGFKIAYTPVGIFIALVFVGLPFVSRTVQPVQTVGYSHCSSVSDSNTRSSSTRISGNKSVAITGSNGVRMLICAVLNNLEAVLPLYYFCVGNGL